ncbi:MAG: class I SAM-dependent methyltransferase [Spirochaetales bacterium]|nr:class I SAM-dependent methyltransferase [Spirochaetales bacterium]
MSVKTVPESEWKALKPCDGCQSESFRFLFSKAAANGQSFDLVECQECRLMQVNPAPTAKELSALYQDTYFQKRTDRGYDNYFSPALRAEIRRVFALNLADLGFFEWEMELFDSRLRRRSLDIGCAAGYFVEFLEERSWQAWGVDISRSALAAGLSRQLSLLEGDFLTLPELEKGSFDLISMWATIEHLESPLAALRRIRDLLAPGGRALLSTCRRGLLSTLYGPRWRYVNVPEHLYYFTVAGIEEVARAAGLGVVRQISYGSGMTTKKGASLAYRLTKKMADPLVKKLNQGDMMALFLERLD